MKKSLAILLAFGLLLQNTVQFGLLVYYNINKTIITQKYCVNKSNPSLHCNGKCFLSKQLKAAEERETKQSKSLTHSEEIISTIPSENRLAVYFPTVSASLFPSYSGKEYPAPVFGIFHPPSV